MKKAQPTPNAELTPDLREKMERLERMASLGQAGASLTHEVRNVMTGVLGFAQVAATRLESNPKSAKELLSQIEGEVHRCLDILNHFLSFMRGDARELAALDTTALLNDVAHLLRHRVALAKVQLHLDIAKDLPRVRGNATSLMQVFVNLVHNALDAMPDGGSLHIAARVDRKTLCVTVTDSGPGIPQALRERVFEPFFTTRGDTKGSGLGLFVCRSIVLAHDGELRIDAEHTGGARFELVLPVLEP